MKHIFILAALFSFIVVASGVSVAQPQPDQKALAEPVGEKENDSFKKDEFASLVFTFWEHEAIQTARDRRGSVREVTDAELMRNLNKGDKEKRKPPPDQRDIALGGIVFRGAGDWTIWLNSKRVTPDALPIEVLDLRVYDEYIEMKWYDEYTEQIFPIRLRPHQRFNIDTRMFLPG